MATRKKTVAESVMALPAAINETILAGLSPDQRKTLTVDQAGRIVQLAGVMSRAVGHVLESPTGKFVMTIAEEPEHKAGGSDNG